MAKENKNERKEFKDRVRALLKKADKEADKEKPIRRIVEGCEPKANRGKKHGN